MEPCVGLEQMWWRYRRRSRLRRKNPPLSDWSRSPSHGQEIFEDPALFAG